MRDASRIIVVLGLVAGMACGASEGDAAGNARTEARQAVSDLVGELQRREAEVVQARAAQEAMAVKVEQLREELAEARGKRPTGAVATRERAARTAQDTELSRLRAKVAQLEAEVVQLRGQDKLADRIAELEKREAKLEGLMASNLRDRVTLSYNLGCLYKASKKYDKAEEKFLEALAIEPDDPAIHYNLGVLYDDCLKQPVRARTHYSRFLELSPNDADAARVVEWLSVMQH